MIGEVVEGILARMHRAIEAEDAKVNGIKSSRSGLDNQVGQAREAVDKAAAAFEAQQNALAEVSAAVLQKKTELAASKEAQKAGDAPFAPMEAEKAKYEA